MGRPRSFSESAVLEAAARAFIAGGYEGTSIDDLVKALNLHRGSLYKAFGSKRGLFLATLRHYVSARLPHLLQSASASGTSIDVLTQRRDLDLLLIAAVERGDRDAEVAALVREALGLLERASDKCGDHAWSEPPADRPARAIALLGTRLYERLHDDAWGTSDRQHQPITKET